MNLTVNVLGWMLRSAGENRAISSVCSHFHEVVLVIVKILCRLIIVMLLPALFKYIACNHFNIKYNSYYYFSPLDKLVFIKITDIPLLNNEDMKEKK